jgi:hypothetical protein
MTLPTHIGGGEGVARVKQSVAWRMALLDMLHGQSLWWKVEDSGFPAVWCKVQESGFLDGDSRLVIRGWHESRHFVQGGCKRDISLDLDCSD